MGSQHKKKKKSPNINVTVVDNKRDQDRDSNRLALQPTFEGTAYTVPIISQTDFCQVDDITGPSQSPS